MPLYQSDLRFARINCDNDGDNTVITPPANHAVWVFGYMMTATTSGLATVKCASGVLAELSFVVSITSNTVITYDGGPRCPAFITGIGEALVINTATGQDVNGHLVYATAP